MSKMWSRCGAVFVLVGLLVALFLIRDHRYYSLVKLNDALLQKTLSSTLVVNQILSYSPTKTSLIVSSSDWQGNLLVRLNYPPALAVGDEVDVIGVPKAGFKTMLPSLVNFLKLKNVWAVLENPQLKGTGEHHFNLMNSLYQTKGGLSNFIANHFSADVAGVLAGVLFGDTDFISLELKNDFRYAGLTHLMAISGGNMTLLGQVIFSLFAFLSLKWRSIIVVFCLVLFTLFVGASAAVLRASFMSILAFTGLYLGRPYAAKRALFLVVITLYFYDPYIVIYDIGLQLSCAATWGLLCLSPLLQQLLRSIPWEFLRTNMSITLAATIFTAPMSLYYFNTLSLLAPLINTFFAPLLSLLFVYGYLFLLFMFIPLLGDITSFCLEETLRLAIVAISYSSQWAQMGMFSWSPHIVIIICIYIGLVFCLKLLQRAMEKLPG